ncbi:hypothetical protein [Pseudomonas aeruginosa]|uniref:hypothetical protein n=1 Tax=Pseudomonas aeruginosa TaxID=287 RepID=UPI0018C61717|nr:hypothetical protein [Pseudomonas aeruginosa]
MESQILGVIGSVLLLGAIAALWIGRLNSAAGKASAGEEAHSSNHHLDETLPAKPKINMVPHVSATPVQASPTEPERVIEMAKVRIPRSSGHPFHEHLTTDSTVIRPPIPRASGH